jgi:hypothetical protein
MEILADTSGLLVVGIFAACSREIDNCIRAVRFFLIPHQATFLLSFSSVLIFCLVVHSNK